MSSEYMCFACRRENVKLWRPHIDTKPLICAKCAEKRQIRSKGYPKWKVNEEGKIPLYDGANHEETKILNHTDRLIVDISDISPYTGETCMLPAIPKGNGAFWGYTSAPEECIQEWKELPTR